MNKFFLTFQRHDLEKQYQIDQLASIKKPVFIFMIFACLFMNVFVLGIRLVTLTMNIWYYQNMAFVVACLIEIVIIVIMKKMQYLQLALTITNIILGFLELNVDPETTTKTEYFAYGNVFMQLQVIIYLISDFKHVIIQIICHFTTRQIITIVLSKKIDFLLMSVGVISLILILITIFVNDRNKRRLFLQTLKDHYLDEITSFLIKEPFLKISLNNERMIFNLDQQHIIKQFPGYSSEICFGCNARFMLRNYYYDIETLEHLLLQKANILLPEQIQILYKKQSYNIRLCKLDVQINQYIIILEQNIEIQKNLQNVELEVDKLKVFLKQSHKFRYQKIYSWGVLSMVLLNQRVLKRINFRDVLIKISRIYSDLICRKQLVSIQQGNSEKYIFTFIYQLKIFFIQFFDILVKIQRKRDQSIQIFLKQDKNYIHMIIILDNSSKLLQKIQLNYFIHLLLPLLTGDIQESENTIIISFKNYPKDSFYHQ